MTYILHNKENQSGAALLAAMIILIVASSYALVTKLNSSVNDYPRKVRSLEVLTQAKAALIGYAVNYPLDHPGVGPGRLPCPDTNNDGSAAGNCTGATTGRFPYKTDGLESEDFRDHFGERLWYRVANNYRSYTVNPPQVNSDSPGNFTVDTTADIVAVLIAPGEPVGTQNRAADQFDVANYLEDDNANTDDVFVTRAAGNFNDIVMPITRQELMSAVEKKVLGDVEESLLNYQTNHGAFPWLSPFEDASTSDFRGELNQIQGMFPFHWAADPESISQGGAISGRNPFTTDINLGWSILNADVTDPGTTSYGSFSGYPLYNGNMVTPDQDCIESNVCTDDNYPGLSIAGDITFTDASCTWSNKEVFECTGTFVNTDVTFYPEVNPHVDWAYAFNIGQNQIILRWDDTNWVQNGSALGEGVVVGWAQNTQIIYAYTETVTRTYSINITFTDDTVDGADIDLPTVAKTRTRDIELENISGTALYNTGSNSVSITIDETRTIEVIGSPTVPSPSTSVSSSRVLTNDVDTTGTLAATGIKYDLDIIGYDLNSDGDFDDANEQAPELPEWFVEDGWHELIYLAYASSEALPGDTTDVLPGPADGIPDNACTSTVDCLTVTINGAVNDDVRAVALSAGVDLTSPTARPSAALTDYFDDVENTDTDETYIKSRTTNTYNDQTRIILTAP